MTRYLMSDGVTDLDVLVPDHTDLDGEFEAFDRESGERIRVRGWMIDSVEELPL